MIKGSFKIVKTKEGKGIGFRNFQFKGKKEELLEEAVNLAYHFATSIPRDFLKEEGCSEEEIEADLFNIKMNLLAALSGGQIGTIDLNEFMKEIEKEEE